MLDMTKLLRDTDRLHQTLKNFEEFMPDDFERLGISKCVHCDGTGLRGRDPHAACNECVGVGYRGFQTIKKQSICPDCNSTGKHLEYENNVTECKTCEGTGRLDWVQAIQKGVRIDSIW